MSLAAPQEAPDARLVQLRAWVTEAAPGFGLDLATLEPASSDASFRRYFRIAARNGVQPSYIIMDAPPDREDVRPFIHVAGLLAQTGVAVPAVLDADAAQGFVLLSDLGRRTYLDELTGDNADALYGAALDALVRMQGLDARAELAPYDRALLSRELALFPEWYVARHLGQALTDAEQGAWTVLCDRLVAAALDQPQVLVHRDYHSRNLMAMPHGHTGPGILDFQDAVWGPLSYDVVSLLRDAYVAWDEERVLDWTVRYWQKARAAQLPVPADFGEFWRSFEWMGLQRHLKVLGIFARLSHRDGKDGYLKDLPRVLQYVRAVAARYGALTPLLRLIDRLEARPRAVGYTF